MGCRAGRKVFQPEADKARNLLPQVLCLRASQLCQRCRTDPLNRVFPKVAKCTFQKFGPSGSLQKHDALCVLPLNIINEKIYVFLYLWFVFLAAVSGIWLVYRLLTIVSHQMRVNVIHARADRQVSKDVIHACLVKDDHSALERLGDFLLLYQITKNVNPLVSKDIFEVMMMMMLVLVMMLMDAEDDDIEKVSTIIIF